MFEMFNVVLCPSLVKIEQCVWSRAGSELSLSEATSGRDSALGSASLVGEGSSFFQTEEEVAVSGGQRGMVVSRSLSLPDQLASLGATAKLAVVPAEATAQEGGAAGAFRGRLKATAAAEEDCDVRSISDSTPPIEL
jgi:hypothetical protein